jgi:hypothetical protein
VKLERSGDSITAYHSADGNDWSQLGQSQEIAMFDDIYWGLAVTSHSEGELCSVSFEDVSINNERLFWPAWADFDGDKDVDFYDFAWFSSHWLNSLCQYPEWCGKCDLNQDGDVDTGDLEALGMTWLDGQP